MYPVEVFSDGPGLIGLQMADEMPDQVISAAGGDLFQSFLDEIFAKIALPGIGGLQNRSKRAVSC